MAGYWSVAQTLPLSEHKAERFLQARGFVCYLPRILNERKRAVPLFINYIFVAIVDQWHQIFSTAGVNRLLTHQDTMQPVKIGEAVIERLRGMETNGIVQLPKKPDKFYKGQRVRVLSGQFAGQLALYEGMSPKDCTCVLVNMLGHWVRTELRNGDKIEEVNSYERREVKKRSRK